MTTDKQIKDLDIIPVKDLLALDLTIPDFQRLYKWTTKHVT